MVTGKSIIMKKWDKTKLRVLSRHGTHNEFLRNKIDAKGLNISIRFGSTTDVGDIKLNPVEAVNNSSNKITMKGLLTNSTRFATFNGDNWEFEGDIITRDTLLDTINYPVLRKLNNRSRGQGMRKYDNREELDEAINAIELRYNSNNPYYLEEFHNYAKEYRIHSSVLTPCFYSCRKALKREHAGEYFKNDSNSCWFMQYRNDELSEDFRQPNNWDEITQACHISLNALGLHIAAFDVIVANNGRFKILESNSAPSMAPVVAEKYIEELSKIVETYV
jgi:D-alanine-D-alanine ligase-like ATP-grasp enzyme